VADEKKNNYLFKSFLIFVVERILAFKFKKTGYDLSLQSSKKDRGKL